MNWLQELKEGSRDDDSRLLVTKRKRREVPRGPCLLFVGRRVSPKAQIFAFPEDKALSI